MNESPGVLIGASNILTRVNARVPAGPALDTDAVLRQQVLARARRALEGQEAYIEDAILHGRRVRLFTNSHHVADFWRENWLREGEWSALTGRPVGREPELTVYVAIDVPEEQSVAYVSDRHREVVLFNTSYYGDVRASCMEALRLILSHDGLRVLHGGAVEWEGRGLLMTYPTEVIHPTPAWGLMESSRARFLADGWLAADAQGRLHRLEKRLYVRASVVEAYPEYAGALVKARFENVPDLNPGLADQRMAVAQALLDTATARDPRSPLRTMAPDRARDFLIRLTSTLDARVMADPVALFGKSRVTWGPVSTATTFTLKAGAGEPIRSAADGFEVHVGAIEGHPREVARVIAKESRRT